MGKIISIANQKGGVGKTTTALNLGVSLAYLAQETLLIDLDPQANLTSGLITKNGNSSADISDVLLDPPKIVSSLAPTKVEFLDMIPTYSGNLVGMELALKEVEKRELRIKEALEPVQNIYRFTLIDCPPSLGLLTVNALCAADYVLIPMSAEYYALEGLSILSNVIQRVQETLNPKLRILGIVFTMVDSRLQLTQAVIKEVRSYFPEFVMDTMIPRNIRLAEAPSYSLPIHIYAPKSQGTQSYMDLGKEILVRIH